MAEGACARAGVSLAIAVTGHRRPGRRAPRPSRSAWSTSRSPAAPTAARHERHLFPGDRAAIRLATVDAALTLALRSLG